MIEDKSRHAQEFDDHYAIHPSFPFWRSEEPYPRGRELAPGFRYSSDTNDRWLTIDELKALVTQT